MFCASDKMIKNLYTIKIETHFNFTCYLLLVLHVLPVPQFKKTTESQAPRNKKKRLHITLFEVTKYRAYIN